MIGNVNVPGALAADIANKVDKINGKGLSTEDYTTAEKNKLAELKNYTGGTGITIDNDGTINCTAASITIDNTISSTSTNPVQNKVINTALGNKVDKVTGKGLSTNDFTDADKNAISQFIGVVIDYGIAQRDFKNLHNYPIYFNKTFTTLPVVFCTYRGTGIAGNDSWCYCRISDVTEQKFCIELFAYNGNSPTYSGTGNFMWFAIGT